MSRAMRLRSVAAASAAVRSAALRSSAFAASSSRVSCSARSREALAQTASSVQASVNTIPTDHEIVDVEMARHSTSLDTKKPAWTARQATATKIAHRSRTVAAARLTTGIARIQTVYDGSATR